MRSRLCRVVTLLGTCLAAAFTHCVQAQRPSAVEQAAYMAGLRIDRSMLAGSLATSPRSAMRLEGGGYYDGTETREMNLMGSGIVLEMPRVGPDGQYVRPRVMIGRQSQELRSWMTAAGLQPERCMLPMFRSRMKKNPETGKVGAAFLVSARCTFY